MEFREAFHGGRGGDSMVSIGRSWEVWASDELASKGYPNTLMPIKYPYDIILNNGTTIDVKSTSKRFNGQWSFFINNLPAISDYLFCVIGPTQDVFIIPTNAIPNTFSIQIKWPSNKLYSEYHNNFAILNSGWKNKTELRYTQRKYLARYRAGSSAIELAAEYGISRQQIHTIVKTRKELEE